MDSDDKMILCWAALIAAVIITGIICSTIEDIHKPSEKPKAEAPK